ERAKSVPRGFGRRHELERVDRGRIEPLRLKHDNAFHDVVVGLEKRVGEGRLVHVVALKQAQRLSVHAPGKEKAIEADFDGTIRREAAGYGTAVGSGGVRRSRI